MGLGFWNSSGFVTRGVIKYMLLELGLKLSGY